jgi:hypothetical protein
MKWASRICSRASAALNEHAYDACDDLSVLRALVDSVPWWLGDLSVFRSSTSESFRRDVRVDSLRVFCCRCVKAYSVCVCVRVFREGCTRARGALFYEF